MYNLCTPGPLAYGWGDGRGISIIQQKSLPDGNYFDAVGARCWWPLYREGEGVNDVLVLGAKDTQGTNSRTSTVTHGPKALKIEGPHKLRLRRRVTGGATPDEREK